MESEKDAPAPVAKVTKRYNKHTLFYRCDADALEQKIRDEFRGSHIAGLIVRYVCRNNPEHWHEERSVSYSEGRFCVFCGCLMSANVVKEQPCTEPQ
ncbi:MAG: hypothetical protein WC120_05350 [Parcubacteria group bacterium]|jgi:hypothetical protein